MPGAHTVQPHHPWSHAHDNQYGWNVLTRLHPHANRALAGLTAFVAFVAVGAGSGGLRAAGVVWSAALLWAYGLYLVSAFARFARSPRCVYRLRSGDYRVLYVGRTKDWETRFSLHTSTDDDIDEPWRWKIDAANSAPFKWCLTPFGEWYSERFRIHQAATLAALRVAPKVHNHPRQHGRPYRSPMIAPAVLLWLAEELLFGTQPIGKEEKDPQDSDSYKPDVVDTVIDDDPEPNQEQEPPAPVAETDDEVFARLVADGWPEGFPACPGPVPDEQGYGPGPGCPESTTPVGGVSAQSCPNPEPSPGTANQPTPHTTEAPTDPHHDDATPPQQAPNPVGEGQDESGEHDEGSMQSLPGAAGGRVCSGNGFGQPCPHDAPPARGPRCAECHRSYERTRKARLRKRTDEMFGDDDAA